MKWIQNPAIVGDAGKHHVADDKAAVYTSTDRPVGTRWTETTAPASYVPLVDDLITRSELEEALEGFEPGGGGDLSTVASLEEIEHPAVIADVSTTATRLLQVCNFDQRVGALTLSTLTAIAPSNTNYWTVELGRYRFNSYAAITSKTTQVPVAESGNEGVTAGWPWTFDVITWNATNRLMQKGDILALKFTPTGSPTAWVGVVATVRCEPGVTA